MDTIITDNEKMTIMYALCNREEFLILQLDNYKYSLRIFNYYQDELNKVKELQKKLNFI